MSEIPQWMWYMLLGEIFSMICLFGSFRKKYKNFSMLLFNLFITSFGVYTLPLSVMAIRENDGFLLILPIFGIVVGGLSLISGIYALWLFSDDYKYMFDVSKNDE